MSQSLNSQVLKAFVHGDWDLFNSYPELQDAMVWVYFHSNIREFNNVECWGPLKEPSPPKPASGSHEDHGIGLETSASNPELPQPCREDCECCFPPTRMSSVTWSQEQELRLPNQLSRGTHHPNLQASD